jgi:hypothetical protein
MELMTWLRDRWDRALGLGLVALGAVLVLTAYHGVSESPQLVAQLSYIISGGAGGLLALGVGVTLLVCGDLREEFHMLKRVEAALRSETSARPEASRQPASTGEPDPDDEPEADLAVLLEMRDSHRPSQKVNH